MLKITIFQLKKSNKITVMSGEVFDAQPLSLSLLYKKNSNKTS